MRPDVDKFYVTVVPRSLKRVYKNVAEKYC